MTKPSTNHCLGLNKQPTVLRVKFFNLEDNQGLFYKPELKKIEQHIFCSVV